MVVAFDESGTAAHGQSPDLGYKGFEAYDNTGKAIYTQHEVREQTLWGTLMGDGAGVEYYFGYQFAENNQPCEDWRSRDASWDYCRIATQFFRENQIPLAEMIPSDELVASADKQNNQQSLSVNSLRNLRTYSSLAITGANKQSIKLTHGSAHRADYRVLCWTL